MKIQIPIFFFFFLLVGGVSFCPKIKVTTLKLNRKWKRKYGTIINNNFRKEKEKVIYTMMEEMINNDENVFQNIVDQYSLLIFNFTLISVLQSIKNRRFIMMMMNDDKFMLLLLLKAIDIFVNSILVPTIIDLFFKYVLHL